MSPVATREAPGQSANVNLQHVTAGERVEVNVAFASKQTIEEAFEQLLRTSIDHRELLAKEEFLSWHGTVVRVQRTIEPALLQASDERALVLVGAPGIGKSSLLSEVARKAEKSRPVILISAGEIGATAIGMLRLEFGLEHSIKDVLSYAVSLGEQVPLLLVDALDATRGNAGKATAIRQLIQTAMTSRWHVVASIRRFDVLWSGEWKRMFRAPVQGTGELGTISHIELGLLDDKELEQIALQAPALAILFKTASKELRELLRVPFNLRLAAELSPDNFSSNNIKSQLDLLDKYWMERVESGDGGEARVAAVNTIASHALSEKARASHEQSHRIQMPLSNSNMPVFFCVRAICLSSHITWFSTTRFRGV